MSEERALPFYCGTQRSDWKSHNCDFCTKRYDTKNVNVNWRCDLEKAIDEGYMDDGSVSVATAQRMGMPEDCRVYNWRCPEFVEDAAERVRVMEVIRKQTEAKRAYDNRNRPAPWIEEWLAKK